MLIESLLGLFLGLILIGVASVLFDALASEAEDRLDVTGSPRGSTHLGTPNTQAMTDHQSRLRHLGGYR